MLTTSTTKGTIGRTCSRLPPSAFKATSPGALEHRPASVVVCYFQTDGVHCQTGCGTVLQLMFLVRLLCVGRGGHPPRLEICSSLFKTLGHNASDGSRLCRRRSFIPSARTRAQDRGLARLINEDNVPSPSLPVFVKCHSMIFVPNALWTGLLSVQWVYFSLRLRCLSGGQEGTHCTCRFRLTALSSWIHWSLPKTADKDKGLARIARLYQLPDIPAN